jgi:MutS domain V
VPFPPVVLALAAAIPLVLVMLALRDRRVRERDRSRIRSSWGSPRRRDRDMEEIAKYHELRRQSETRERVDERTWTDLDLDALFVRLDRTESTLGQQMLYDILRTPHADGTRLERFHRLATHLGANREPRERLQLDLARLSQPRGHFLPHLFLAPLPERVPFRFLYPLLTLLAITSAIGLFIAPLFVIPFAVLSVVNIGLQLYHRRRIYEFIQPLRILNLMIASAGTVAKSADETVHAASPGLATNAARLAPLKRTTAWLIFETEGGANDLTNLIYSYLNMFFLFDVNAFVSSLGFVEREKATIRAVFEALGTIDAAISVASFREGSEHWCLPQLTAPPKQLTARGLYHPLLTSPVANDLQVDRTGVLVTGSNMSGKSTFLRTVGVNAILAQSIATVLGESWEAPSVIVKTSIGRGDDLLAGKSYYLAEVERVGELIAAAGTERPHLFIIDEIFRGTNTVERIAASKGVLEWLGRGDDLVFVATHDIELIELLGDGYAYYHFREDIVDGELRFGYRIHPGPSSTRNAIALLELYKFPERIVQDALTVVETLERR